MRLNVWRKPRKVTAEDVLSQELQKAHRLHPNRLLPSSVIAALDDAGFIIISHDDLENEIALAHAAGREEAMDE